MGSDLFAVIAPDSPRARFWQSVFLGLACPIKGDAPRDVTFAEDGEVALAHFADLDRLDPVQYSRLLIHLAENWGVTMDEAAGELLTLGLPIVCGDDLTITADPGAILARNP